MPLRDANISVMTHAFNYGTAVFEGIRAYWNAEQEQLYGARPDARTTSASMRSARLLMMELPYIGRGAGRDRRSRCCGATACARTSTSGRSSTSRARSSACASTTWTADVTIFGVPFGKYIDTEGGIRAQVSTWRRTDDNAIPARGKITGAYVNGAFAKSEAQLNGYDEAIVLTQDGHVSEGSAENLFIVRDGEADHAAGHRQHPGGHHPRRA